jgi:hypothetical protein
VASLSRCRYQGVQPGMLQNRCLVKQLAPTTPTTPTSVFVAWYAWSNNLTSIYRKHRFDSHHPSTATCSTSGWNTDTRTHRDAYPVSFCATTPTCNGEHPSSEPITTPSPSTHIVNICLGHWPFSARHIQTEQPPQFHGRRTNGTNQYACPTPCIPRPD